MATMGLACIMSAFQEASMFFTHTNGCYGAGYPKASTMRVVSHALAFIQGTGLDITIRSYGLDLDANELRYKFYRIFHVKV